MYSKTCVKRQLSKRTKMVFKTNYTLMQVKSIAKCFEWSFYTGFTVLSILDNISLTKRGLVAFIIVCIHVSVCHTQNRNYNKQRNNTDKITALEQTTAEGNRIKYIF